MSGWYNSGTILNDVEVSTVHAAQPPNPPSLNPTNWDTPEETLWIAVCHGVDNNVVQAAAPTSFTDLRTVAGQASNDSASISIATLNSTAASVDPAAWLTSMGRGGAGYTIGIRPAAGADVTVSVPLAILAITEQTPTVARTDNHVISVPVDTLTVSEQTPTVARTDNHIITVPVDTLTISAQTPTVDVAANKTISVPVDILTVVANAPVVVRTDYQVVAVPVAALTLTPATPTVTIPVTYNQVSFRVYLDDGTSLGA